MAKLGDMMRSPAGRRKWRFINRFPAAIRVPRRRRDGVARSQSLGYGLILPYIPANYWLAMSRPLIRQVFVLLLAVFVTVGASLSAVQASTMNLKMMDMAHQGMTSSANGSCDDCAAPGNIKEAPGNIKGITACVTAGCVAPAATHAPPTAGLNIVFAAVHYLPQNLVPLGRNSGPDPYPPRPTDIA